MEEDREERLRRRAEERRWRLLNKGAQRIHQLEIGQTHKNTDRPAHPTTRPGVEAETTTAPSQDGPSGSGPHKWKSRSASSSSRRTTLAAVSAVLAVFVAIVIPHPQQPQTVFHPAFPVICSTFFCVLQLVFPIIRRLPSLHLFIMILLPLVELTHVWLFSFRQMLAGIFLLLVFVASYLAITYAHVSATAMMQYLMECALRHASDIGQSYGSIQDYISDYAVFYFVVSCAVLLVSLCTRASTHTLGGGIQTLSSAVQ